MPPEKINTMTLTLDLDTAPAVVLRTLRAASGLSQRAVAERASIAAETLSRAERGHRRPRAATLQRVLDVLEPAAGAR